MSETLLGYLQGSTKYDFNFISTLQKCLTRMTQPPYYLFLDFSMKAIATQSNTLDYAVLFTE